MGYRTVIAVPRVVDFAQAQQIYKNAVPIRGHTPEVRPLGERRNHNTFSIREQGCGSIELVLYETPVITFRPTGEILLQTNGWNSVSTHQFIDRVLRIPAHGQENKTVVTLHEGKYVVPKTGGLLLKYSAAINGLELVGMHQVNYGYRLNRKALTKVRTQYSEFTKYFNAMLKLRREESKYGVEVIKIPAQEFADGFGVTGDPVRIENKLWLDLTQSETFWDSIKGRDDGGSKFHMGFLCVAANRFASPRYGWIGMEGRNTTVMNITVHAVDGLKKHFTETLVRKHAEVIEKFAYPMGTFPRSTTSSRYQKLKEG